MTARLSDVERAERDMLEEQLSALIIDPNDGLAPFLGWDTFHVRPARTKKGWRTPTEGSLAKGWLDLVLVRARDRRLIFAELKRQLEVPTPEQTSVLAIFAALAAPAVEAHAKSDADAAALAMFVKGLRGPRVETYVWRPSDLRAPVEESVIYRVLR